MRSEEVAHRAVRLREAEEAVRVVAVAVDVEVEVEVAAVAEGAGARTVGGRYMKVVPESTMVER